MASAKESDHEAVRTGPARRRGHGEGAIYRDEARGRWVGQIDLGMGLNGKRRRPKVFGRTKTEVRARPACPARLARLPACPAPPFRAA